MRWLVIGIVAVMLMLVSLPPEGARAQEAPTATPTATSTPVPTGGITVAERTACDASPCPTMFFETRGAGLSDFQLTTRRGSLTYPQRAFSGLVAGTYRICQTDDGGLPVVEISAQSNLRRLLTSERTTCITIALRPGEFVLVDFTNSTPTPTPSPTATPTVPASTSTPVPTATPSPAVQVLPPQVVVVQVPAAQPEPSVRISPPNTGDGGLLACLADVDGDGAVSILDGATIALNHLDVNLNGRYDQYDLALWQLTFGRRCAWR